MYLDCNASVYISHTSHRSRWRKWLCSPWNISSTNFSRHMLLCYSSAISKMQSVSFTHSGDKCQTLAWLSFFRTANHAFVFGSSKIAEWYFNNFRLHTKTHTNLPVVEYHTWQLYSDSSAWIYSPWTICFPSSIACRILLKPRVKNLRHLAFHFFSCVVFEKIFRLEWSSINRNSNC